jgi:hypothetical protein
VFRGLLSRLRDPGEWDRLDVDGVVVPRPSPSAPIEQVAEFAVILALKCGMAQSSVRPEAKRLAKAYNERWGDADSP